MTEHGLTPAAHERIWQRIEAGMEDGSPADNAAGSQMWLKVAALILVIGVAAAGIATTKGRHVQTVETGLPGPLGDQLLEELVQRVRTGDGGGRASEQGEDAHLQIDQRTRNTEERRVVDLWRRTDGTGCVRESFVPHRPDPAVRCGRGLVAVGWLDPSDLGRLAAAPDPIEALRRSLPDVVVPSDVADELVTFLAWPGVDPALRSGALQLLLALGFEAGVEGDPEADTLLLVGPGPDEGSGGARTQLRVTFDRRTTLPVSATQVGDVTFETTYRTDNDPPPN